MPEASTTVRPGRARTAIAATAGALVALTLAACGGEDEPADGAPAADRQATETVAQPPPETAPEGRGAQDQNSGAIADTAASGPEACPDVPVTPGSGEGLFQVGAEGLTCADAVTALESWGRSGFPSDGPPGFGCEEVAENADGSTRLRCAQEGAGGVLEFTTGG